MKMTREEYLSRKKKKRDLLNSLKSRPSEYVGRPMKIGSRRVDSPLSDFFAWRLPTFASLSGMCTRWPGR